MRSSLAILFGLALTCLSVVGQSPTKKQIKQAWRNIPTDMQECLDRLDILFSDSTKTYFARKDEAEAVAEFNLVTGMSIRNNWNLWTGSTLSQYFNTRKIYDPEVMTGFIFTSYHRKLNNQPVAFENQLTEYFALTERLKANPPKPTDYFHAGDTVVENHFESKGFLSDMLGKQPGYEITALIRAVDTPHQQFFLSVLDIRLTTGKEKREVSQISFENQLISKGSEFWTDISWWRPKGHLTGLHVVQ